MNRRHRIYWRILRPVVELFLKIKFGYTFDRAQDLPEKYIVLSNHTTDFDPLFVAASFRQQMYFVASEHITRWKRFFPMIDHLFAPIIRQKGTVAASTVIMALRKIKEGSNVCIFAEGVRSWDGVTGPILPSTGKVVKKAGCGLVTYKLTGGYFVSPNWSLTSNTRRGPIHGGPVGMYTAEEIAAMTVDEVNAIINRDLYEDAYERQLADPKPYRGKNLAEQLENLLFVCPACGDRDTFHSHGNTVTCASCGLAMGYDTYGMLTGVPQKLLPHQTVRDLAAWQRRQVAEDAAAGMAYTAGDGTLSMVKKQQETLVAQGEIRMTPETLRCGDREIAMADISDMAITGRRALVFTAGKMYYEMIPAQGFNAIKFLYYYESVKKQEAQRLAAAESAATGETYTVNMTKTDTKGEM
ncbi:MAG: 1-acyl-sn-glycerol-3-phosphate acyltransferase [Lachnospiraceae bacterium]|nr:1-acyl-sn-glycerol-3-phosphate acyltransferase [Lachnospiraceae bacterium]